ncbi:MAG: phage/plasmid primase, P4 family [Defluviitaleaceae bacterium]|nr:phage/plasmid primase, P4 family [Defluviitaleaceae bacterium]
MDFYNIFKEKKIEASSITSPYPQNDIGTAQLFYDLHKGFIRYVMEAKTWYIYNGRMWVKDDGAFHVMELCKCFTRAYAEYAMLFDDGTPEMRNYIKYTTALTGQKRRAGIMYDARSIQPLKLAAFDRDVDLLNCANGTFSLYDMALLPHRPADYLTKQADVNFVPGAVCERWEQFIMEIMCGDMDTARFLQKALGYCLTGNTSLECFFILYGASTRNGKSTLMGTVENILGDYARNAQPQTLARRNSDGGAPTPDIARLKGARLVSTPEPEKRLELNTALIKQLTGGDTFTGRLLHENPVEFTPEFKIFINTNYLPRTEDNTIFSSERVKLIPFTRHFLPNEQDKQLKAFFQKNENKSGILNWLIEGYRLLVDEGLTVPERVAAAIEDYKQSDDDFGHFCIENLAPAEGNKLKTSLLYERYKLWAKTNGCKTWRSQDFVGELRRRYGVTHNGRIGNHIENYVIKK